MNFIFIKKNSRLEAEEMANKEAVVAATNGRLLQMEMAGTSK
jgi:hypothetical protein